MPEEKDVYHAWLGITETVRPLNFYQLLRLPQFEDNLAKIRAHYTKMSDHIEKLAKDDYAKQARDLLAELDQAIFCLTDKRSKRDYDESLGRENLGELQQRSFEEILLANKIVDKAQLDKASGFADAVGLDLRDAVLQQKLAAADIVMLAYAESLGMSFVDLPNFEIDENLIPKISPNMARQHSCVPLMIDRGQLLIASPNPLTPDVEEDLRLRFDMPIRTMLCTPAQINTVVAKYYPQDAPESANPRADAQQTPQKKKSRPDLAAKPEAKAENRRNAAVIAFCLTIIVVMNGLGFATDLGLWPRVFLSIIFGIIAGAGAFLIKK